MWDGRDGAGGEPEDDLTTTDLELLNRLRTSQPAHMQVIVNQPFGAWGINVTSVRDDLDWEMLGGLSEIEKYWFDSGYDCGEGGVDNDVLMYGLEYPGVVVASDQDNYYVITLPDDPVKLHVWKTKGKKGRHERRYLATYPAVLFQITVRLPESPPAAKPIAPAAQPSTWGQVKGLK